MKLKVLPEFPSFPLPVFLFLRPSEIFKINLKFKNSKLKSPIQFLHCDHSSLYLPLPKLFAVTDNKCVSWIVCFSRCLPLVSYWELRIMNVGKSACGYFSRFVYDLFAPCCSQTCTLCTFAPSVFLLAFEIERMILSSTVKKVDMYCCSS